MQEGKKKVSNYCGDFNTALSEFDKMRRKNKDLIELIQQNFKFMYI